MKKFILVMMILAILVPGFAGSVPTFENNPCFAAAVQYQSAVTEFDLCCDANWRGPTGRWLTTYELYGYEDAPCYWQDWGVTSARMEVNRWCGFEQES